MTSSGTLVSAKHNLWATSASVLVVLLRILNWTQALNRSPRHLFTSLTSYLFNFSFPCT